MKLAVLILVASIPLSAANLVVSHGGYMHGEIRGFPFPILTNRGAVGGVGIVGWTVPLEKDRGANPPPLCILDAGGFIMNVASFGFVSFLAACVIIDRRSYSQNVERGKLS
jgi:hypothetical protein